jgi:hypothetical protein
MGFPLFIFSSRNQSHFRSAIPHCFPLPAFFTIAPHKTTRYASGSSALPRTASQLTSSFLFAAQKARIPAHLLISFRCPEGAHLGVYLLSLALLFFTMSSGASSTTAHNTYNLNVRNMTFFSKPEIDISLARSENSQNSYVTSFSTLDKIEGVATISAKKDTRFDDLQISFIGK